MFEILSQNLDNRPRCIGLGSFDGVHKGHQYLIQSILDYSKNHNLRPSIITFQPLPAQSLTEGQILPIYTISERIALFRKYGILDVIVFDFTKVRDLPWQDYLNLYLSEINAKALYSGTDHRFGKKGEGDINCLLDWAKGHDITVHINDFLYDEEQEKISSRYMRHALQTGNLRRYEQMCGRLYSIEVSQQNGAGIGKKIGYPTINAQYPHKTPIPHGVYATKFNGQLSITNYGYAPTLKNENEALLEIHLLEQNHIAVSQNTLEFLEYIRPEKRFETVKELTMQIDQDIKHVISQFTV